MVVDIQEAKFHIDGQISHGYTTGYSNLYVCNGIHAPNHESEKSQ